MARANLLAVDFRKGVFACSIRTPCGGKKLLMVALAERIAARTVVKECPGITRTFMLKGGKNQDEYILQTEGANFRELLRYRSMFDVNALESNDIGASLDHYGVESARAAIIQQIDSVFKVYGIKVNPRHLMLIADYMTFDGDFKPFNRIGLASNPSPFLKMSFETTAQFLKEAASQSAYDTLRSPSARLVLGQPVRNGTGMVNLRLPF